jgi:septum formation topological specificity factor MinE
MSDHIPDVTKMISDTPRTESFNCYDSGCDDPLHAWGAFSAELERELNSANERIQLLIAERDTARRQADQNYKLREEFRELLGTDDVEQGVAVVREMKERISKLYDYVAALETGGDLMAYELSFGYEVDLWNKARGEAKP